MITVSATAMGSRSSAVRGQVLTSASGSVESLTVLHGLGQTPTKILSDLRTIIGTTSNHAVALVLLSYDKTVATFILPQVGAPANNTTAMFDIILENTHSFVI